MPDNLDCAVFFGCDAPRRCELRHDCPEMDTPHQHLLATTDGGRTWRRRGSIKSREEEGARRPGPAATAPDGTTWRLVEVRNEDGLRGAYDIVKRLPGT